MFDIYQLVLSLVSFFLLQSSTPSEPQLGTHHDGAKSVAIVGAGSAGLAMLRALVDLEDSNIEIVLYEQRRDVGGIWLPDTQPVSPPVLPETPLYPLLHTNTPVPTMTYPGFPFPPGTPLFAPHEQVQAYHRDFALHYNLMPYILLNHTVLSASWVGSPDKGRWDVVVLDHSGNGNGNGREIRRSFDHLVVANGHNNEPHVVTFPGQDEWLRHRRRREILHSIYYREPERYANQTVVVIGSGSSASDAASQVSLYARKVYHSVRDLRHPADGAVEVKPEITHFTRDAIVFADGSRAYNVDSVILATGYDLRVPFLEATDEVAVRPQASARGPEAFSGREQRLTTNLRYLFPLHQHIFSLCTSYPPNALAFIGLQLLVPNCPTDLAQSIYAAHAIANASVLPPREALLAELDECEDDLRALGYDPYYVGHRMVVGGSGFDYEDALIERLERAGAIPTPPPSPPPEEGDSERSMFVEKWRRDAPGYKYLKRGWKRVEALGLEREWLKGVESEEEWAEMMERLDAWQGEWETARGLVFPEEPTLY